MQPPAGTEAAIPPPPVEPRPHVRTQWGDYIPKDTAQFKYGWYWNGDDSALQIELRAFKLGIKVSDGGLGKANHFRECTNILWGEQNPQKQFIWHPWADTMLEKSLEHKYLSVGGCANSGKSDFYAVYAIINWLADPVNTMVLITSTSLKESKGRIWGSLEEYWNSAQKICGESLPGKLVSTLGLIRLNDPTGEYKTSDRSGIHLIAGEKKKEKDAIGKLIGMKKGRVFLIADELPELSHAILTAAYSNLDANPEFQLIGIGNPNSIYDPHGALSRPKDGWQSVTPEHHEWETERGYFIRFDALRSPNVLAGRVIYPWLPRPDKVEAKKKELGEDSVEFWRMWRGYWCPSGESESVVAQGDIISFDCEKKVERWQPGTVHKVAFLDPAYTWGGDRSVVYFGTYGVNMDSGKWTLQFDEYVILRENVLDKVRSRNFQIAEKFKLECEKRGVAPDHAAVDCSGAAAFGDIVHEIWSSLVVRTEFGGGASDVVLRVEKDGTKVLASDKFKNRVTEIWCSMREYIRGGQIRGIHADLGLELTQRKMNTKKSGPDLKASVESKEIMRGRCGFSPDIGDAGNGLLDLCRRKFKFKATVKEKKKATTKKNWGAFTKKSDFFGRHNAVLDRTA